VNLDQIVNDFSLPVWLRYCGSFFTALLITWLSIPTIVRISNYKNLYGRLNERSSHTDETPNLGGLAIFAGFILAVIIFTLSQAALEIKYLFGASTIIFLIGMKDDILIIDPKKKLIGQMLAALLIVWLGGIRITNFHHALGIDGISALSSLVFSLFLVVLIINGYNLIDGIDGLSSGCGIIAALFFGSWFIAAGNTVYAIISISLAGALTAFFRFNITSGRNKIFLGDTGSMLTGFVISVLTIKFLEFDLSAPGKLQIKSAPSVAVAVLIVPLFDTLRVFILRLWNGKSPFKADRQHIHHMLLRLGYSHAGAGLLLMILNLAFIALAWLMKGLGDVVTLSVLMLAAIILTSVPSLILSRTSSDKTDTQEIN